MANISDQMDEIFDDGLDFDVIFDDDDKLIDTVAGVKEDGTSVLGDEYEGFFDENGDFFMESDVSIPGEPSTDDGKQEDKAGKADLLNRTTDTKNDVKDQKLNRDAESDGTAAAPQSAMAKVDDEEGVGAFRKGLGYTKEEADVSAPGEADTDDGKNEESAGNAAAKTTMANGQNEQKPDDNTSVKTESVDDELFDEAVIAPTLDEELFDESSVEIQKTGLDAELLDESFLNEEAAEVDPEEELIDAVDGNDSAGENLDYEVGADDVMLDDLLN